MNARSHTAFIGRVLVLDGEPTPQRHESRGLLRSAVRVSFVKGEKVDRVYVQRDDDSEASWSFPSYGERALPHDLMHFAIEKAIAMDDGIYARIAAGADLRRINRAAERARGKVRDKYVALGEDLDGVLLSEALAATDWRTDGDDATREALWRECERYALSPPPHLDVAAVRAAVHETLEAWRAVPVGEALVLYW